MQLIGIHQQKLVHIYPKPHTSTFMVALFVIAPNSKCLKYPSIVWWISYGVFMQWNVTQQTEYIKATGNSVHPLADIMWNWTRKECNTPGFDLYTFQEQAKLISDVLSHFWEVTERGHKGFFGSVSNV